MHNNRKLINRLLPILFSAVLEFQHLSKSGSKISIKKGFPPTYFSLFSEILIIIPQVHGIQIYGNQMMDESVMFCWYRCSFFLSFPGLLPFLPSGKTCL